MSPRASRYPDSPPDGFTLVELLVVVSIIVLLLAMLLPALSRSVYLARLAACGAQQKTIGAAAVDYAMNHARSYPYKPAVENSASNWQAISLRQPDGPWSAYDDRPTLAPYIPINKLLNDPLAERVDLEDTHPLSHVFSNVSMWFGFQYDNEVGLEKIGDRFTYAPYTFEVLVSDRDCYRGADTQSSHPDKRGVLYNHVRQDSDHPWLGGNQGVGAASGQVVKITMSLWVTFTPGARRGPVDNNFTFQDLSVHLYDDVEYNDQSLPGSGIVRIRTFVDKGDTNQAMPRQ